MTPQSAVRTALIRGGTSKGLYFHAADLPAPGPGRDALLCRLMGSPDVLQIDGLGGSRPITSKVAIIAGSTREDADVDYTFGQVEIDRASIGWSGNCGNISAGVGPFAVDEGLVEAVEPVTTVRIHNTNTGVVLVAEVPVADGAAAVEGDFAVPGVPGTGARIGMNWADSVGATTGRLLPTGEPVQDFPLTDGSVVAGSLVDAANPVLWVEAAAFGLTGSELTEIDGDVALLARLRDLRGRAAVAAGFCDDPARADLDSPGLPMVGLVAAPADYRTLSGERAASEDMDLRARVIFMNRLHQSIPGTGSICLAAASRTPGTVVADLLAKAGVPTDTGTLRIGHPSGVTPAEVRASESTEAPHVRIDELGFARTARRLMDGRAYVPRGVPGED